MFSLNEPKPFEDQCPHAEGRAGDEKQHIATRL
jgi:hypothetical protein